MKLLKKNSHTLIELLITISLIMVLAVFTLPKTTFSTRTQVLNEINKLFAIFSYLQQRALATNSIQEFSINQEKNIYFFTINNKKECVQSLSKQIIFGVKKGIHGPPTKPIHVITKPITFPSSHNLYKVTFTPKGKITPGTLYLSDKNYQYQGALTCPISQVSYVRRYLYENNQWKCI